MAEIKYYTGDPGWYPKNGGTDLLSATLHDVSPSGPPPKRKPALAAHLCVRKPSDNASGEAFWTLYDDYDPTGHPKRHGRVRGHVREV